DVSSKLPEMLYTTLSPVQLCHFDSGWAPQFKFLAAYVLPWQVRLSGNFQSLPGPARQAAVVYSQAQVQAGLGRVATGAGNKSALGVEPAIPLSSASGSGTGTPLFGSVYGDRLNQLDVRFSKIFKFGKSQLDANVD